MKAFFVSRICENDCNYIKSEGLYMTKIYPKALVKDLSDKELYNLYKNLVKVGKESYKVQSEWDRSRKYTDYQEFMLIYGSEQDPDGNPVKKIDTKDKRKTSWVPRVQVIGQ